MSGLWIVTLRSLYYLLFKVRRTQKYIRSQKYLIDKSMYVTWNQEKGLRGQEIEFGIFGPLNSFS